MAPAERGQQSNRKQGGGNYQKNLEGRNHHKKIGKRRTPNVQRPTSNLKLLDSMFDVRRSAFDVCFIFMVRPPSPERARRSGPQSAERPRTSAARRPESSA